MHKFSYSDALSTAEALDLVNATSRPLAGGTDLIPLIKDDIVAPATLVNLKHAEDLRFLREDADGLHIGSLTTLNELDRSPLVRGRYQALAEAAGLAASPQLRNVATIGGNLLQQVRCWYYRADFVCWMKGGDECQARTGEHQYHAIFDQSPCVAVYPSDPPSALIALDGRLRIIGSAGERTVTVAEFLQPPTDDRRVMHTLASDEIIVEILIPPASGRSVYLKAMDRAVWAYALASVAGSARVEDGRLNDVRIVLGGVANTPVRLTAVEALVEGQTADAALFKAAGATAIEDATPLAKNRYKVPLVRNLVSQALRDLLAGSSNG